MEFDTANYSEYQLDNLPNESRFYHGQIIKWARDLEPNTVLFAGETKETALLIMPKINAQVVITTGYGDVDHEWDFDGLMPQVLGDTKFNLVITQAIIEHLTNPYGFIKNLATLLYYSGHMITHTVQPGFPYHKAPIDCLRFYPDWFEKVAERLGLDVVRKAQMESHLFYMFGRSN